MDTKEITQAVDEIMFLYENHGNKDYIGEPVSQIEHMCQCAQLAEENGADDEVVLAAFFHDIGHLCEFAYPDRKMEHMDNAGIVDHEKLGADYLRNFGFSEKIAKLIQSHVDAKRYLTYKFPDYYNQLSDASKKTLQFQGGVMTADEALVFEMDDLFQVYILIRKWDDLAKLSNKPLPAFNTYRSMMLAHLASQIKQ